MRKRNLSSVSILFAALCLVCTACSHGMTAGRGTGTVRVVISGESARSVNPASGLPVFDEINTNITVTKEDGSKLAEGTGKSPVTLTLDIGTKITVKVVVTAAAGVWSGSTEYTVKAGDNPVTVKLSKTPKSVRNILSSVISQTPYGDAKVMFKLASGKELIRNVDIGGNYIIPVTARDSTGRIYVLYSKSGLHFTRFDAEGNEDAGFDDAIIPLLPSAVGIEAMTVDPKTDTIFVACGDNCVYAITETSHNTFTPSDGFNRTILSDIGSNKITGAAAYDNTLFLAAEESNKTKLVVCKATVSGNTLSLTAERSVPLNKLRTGSNSTTCTGVFADANGAYCLLREQELGANCYSVGALAYYSSATKSIRHLGLHPDAGSNAKSLAFKSDTFSNPVGFIGYDEDHIYIADDGINIAEVNENFHGNGNQNYIVTFNPKMGELTFTKSDATWYQEYPVYKYPETPVLLWEKDTNVPPTYHGVRYWVSTDGTSSAPTEATKIFQTTGSTNEITDIFCYDQEGNLYILWKESMVYCVTRFELKNGTYDFTQGQQLNLGISDEVVAIATDVSDGQKFLYCAAKKPSTTYKIKQWQWDSTFTGAPSTAYNITLPSGKTLTALAANKDGVFVGVRELDSSQTKYTLKVGKYAKDTGAADGEKIIVKDHLLQTPHNVPLHESYTDYHETLAGLQVLEGVLYAITSKLEKNMKYGDPAFSYHGIDEFKSSGILYKIGKTEEGFSGNVEDENKYKKNFISPEGSNPGIGYGFYRFIAVKPKKLVIASDGACAVGGNASGSSSFQARSDDKVLTYDLDGNLNSPEEKKAGGKFSMELRPGSGFKWE